MLKLYRSIHHLGRHIWDFIGTALLDQTLVSGISFFVGFFLARHLGMDLFGQFSLLLLIAYFCLEIQRAIIIAPMMNLLARDDMSDYLPQLGYIQILMNLGMSLAAAAFVYLSGFVVPKWGVSYLAGPTCFLVFARLQQEFLRRVFFVRSSAKYALWLDTITFCCILISLLTLAHTHRLTIHNVIWWHVAAYLCPSFIFMRYLLHPRFNIAEWPNIIREHITFGQWLMGSTLVQFMSSNWLIMTCGAMLGANTVGLFKSAQYLTGGVTMLFQALENVVPLRLSRLYRLSDIMVRQRYLKQVALFLLVFISLYIIAMLQYIPFFAHYMKVYDEGLFYRMASGLLYQSFLLGPVLLLTYILRARAQTKFIFYTNIITAAITVLSAPWVIRTWHEMGVVYGISLIQVVIMLCLSAFILGRRYA